MAEAPASSAIFALVVKLQFPRCTKMTSPTSYQTPNYKLSILKSLSYSDMEIHDRHASETEFSKFNSKKPEYLILRLATTIGRVSQGDSSVVGMLFF